MTKLYAYTDESGRGALPFIVAVVVVGDGRDELADMCERIERDTGKGRTKWQKADYGKRLAYLRAIVNDGQFAGALYCATFAQVEDYDAATVAAIARAIERTDPTGAQRVAVLVDALPKKKESEYATQLRRRVTSSVNVRGVKRDESSPLIRLADALAGFVNDVQEEQSEEVVTLFARAQRAGMIAQI